MRNVSATPGATPGAHRVVKPGTHRVGVSVCHLAFIIVVTNNSSFQNYPHLDDHTIRTISIRN